VLVKGSLESGPGVERRERAIVTVTILEAAPATPYALRFFDRARARGGEGEQ
jgi:hypothetical protein